MAMIDETHSPDLVSWVSSANQPDCDFPIQNLPVGAFSLRREDGTRCGVAIGDQILEIAEGDLLWFMRLPAARRRALRLGWSRMLRKGASAIPLHAQADCRMQLPCVVGDYTDFYASLHHATNVGRLFRPDSPLLPNYRHVPVGYHGRASSIVVSGTPIKRPAGQLGRGEFGPTRELDYEVELGCFVGLGNALGEPIGIEQTREHMVGVCLLNDWSARDIQRWEYQPLGPFLGKSFSTSIAPWIVTAEALAPFWVDAPVHDESPLPYLFDRHAGALAICVEAAIQVDNVSTRLSHGHVEELYWTFPQMIAHHTSNGCNLRPGDLLGSGTISGPDRENRGCLLELTSKGAEPVSLPNGKARSFLHDGDSISLTAYSQREGFRRIGFGCCHGTIRG